MLITNFITFIMHVKGPMITSNMVMGMSNVVITQGISP
jgi:hypothetical protein